MLAKTPKPPYWAVVFSSTRTPAAESEYAQTADEMVALASKQPGFLGIDSVRDQNGVGITVSYWDSEQSIIAFKQNADHLTAQRLGRETFYRSYELRVAKVERAYSFNRDS